MAGALLTDRYQLAMLQAQLEEGLQDTAVFELFVLSRRAIYCSACAIAWPSASRL